MELTPLRIALAAGILLVIFLMICEVRGWLSGARISTPRQKALRVVSASVMIVVMAMIAVGDGWISPLGPLAVMGYWTICFGLAASLVVLALFDIKEVGMCYGQDKKRLFRDLAKPSDKEQNGES